MDLTAQAFVLTDSDNALCLVASFHLPAFWCQFFVYHYIQVMYYAKTVTWGAENVTLANTVGSLLAFYVLYDLVR
jgi:hypothetical protein